MTVLPPGPAVMLRYGEVFLKSDPVRREFTNTLVRNCREALRSEGLSPAERITRGRIFFCGEPAGQVAAVLSRRVPSRRLPLHGPGRLPDRQKRSRSVRGARGISG